MSINQDKSDLRFFGFSHAEWSRALANDPAAQAGLDRFFASVPMSAMNSGLAQIGVDSLLALATVSQEFTRRVVAQLEGTNPAWRIEAERLLARQTEGGQTSPLWRDFLDLVDRSNK